MNTLWVCEVKPDAVGEPVYLRIMESEDIAALKQRGCEIADERGVKVTSWIRGPRSMEQYQMELGDGSILTIR